MTLLHVVICFCIRGLKTFSSRNNIISLLQDHAVLLWLNLIG